MICIVAVVGLAHAAIHTAASHTFHFCNTTAAAAAAAFDAETNHVISIIIIVTVYCSTKP